MDLRLSTIERKATKTYSRKKKVDMRNLWIDYRCHSCGGSYGVIWEEQHPCLQPQAYYCTSSRGHCRGLFSSLTLVTPGSGCPLGKYVLQVSHHNSSPHTSGRRRRERAEKDKLMPHIACKAGAQSYTGIDIISVHALQGSQVISSKQERQKAQHSTAQHMS
jgi:hypothetical protein